MWRDEEISEADLESLDVEMDEEESSSEDDDEISDDDEIILDDTEEDAELDNEQQNDYRTDGIRMELRSTRRGEPVNYAIGTETTAEESQNSLSLRSENSTLIETNSSSSSSSSSNSTTQNTFSATEIVGQPRVLSQHNSQLANPQPINQTVEQPNNNDNNQINNDSDRNQAKVADEEEEEETNKNPMNDSSEIVDTCLICCEPFTSTSEHRIVSLKCGHIYGKHCIEKWLQTKESKRRCPKCNQVSNKNDIRIIYAKSIVAVDTSELDQTKKELEDERKLRLIYEQQVEELKFDLGLKESENIHLKREIDMKNDLIKRFKSSNGNPIEVSLNQAKMKSLNKEPFTHLQTIDLKIEGCRIILITEVLGYILISQQTSPNSLLKGFGILRIPLNNLNISDFIYLHTAQIKDMTLHPVDALLLTASFDKKVKIVNLITKEKIANFDLDAKPWSVTWNKALHHLFYIGLNNGFILEGNAQTKTIIKKINTCLGVPIKLVRYLNHNTDTNRVNLLTTSIKSSFFCEIKSNHDSPALNLDEEDSVVSMKPIPISGPIISTNIIGDNNSGNILLTVRPNAKFQKNVQHYVLDYKVDMSDNEIKYSRLNTLLGGSSSKHLIISKLVPHPDNPNSLLIISGDEDTQGAIVWSYENEKPIQKFNFHNVVFDSAFYKPHQSSEPILALLTERHLKLYKWTN